MKTNKMRNYRISRISKQAVGPAVGFSLLAGIVLLAPPRAVEAAASQFDQTFGSGGKVVYVTASGSAPGDI